MFIDYQNQNRFQSSPLVGPVTYLTTPYNDWFIDCGVILRHAVGWRYADSCVLEKVESNSGYCTVTIKATGSIQAVSFSFTVNQSDPPGTSYWATGPNSLGRAFITIGRIHANFFAGTGTNLTTNIEIRKEKVHTFFKREIRQIHVANQYSTLYQDNDCFSPTVPLDDFEITATSLNGDIKFSAGRHADVLIIPSVNTISVSVTNVAGIAGDVPCQSPRTLPPGYSTSNEPKCGDLLYTINGVGPVEGASIFVLEGSPGVSVQSVPGSLNALLVQFVSPILFNYGASLNNCATSNPYNHQSYNCVY